LEQMLRDFSGRERKEFRMHSECFRILPNTIAKMCRCTKYVAKRRSPKRLQLSQREPAASIACMGIKSEIAAALTR
jgi:hypothetical protein